MTFILIGLLIWAVVMLGLAYLWKHYDGPYDRD